MGVGAVSPQAEVETLRGHSRSGTATRDGPRHRTSRCLFTNGTKLHPERKGLGHVRARKAHVVDVDGPGERMRTTSPKRSAHSASFVVEIAARRLVVCNGVCGRWPMDSPFTHVVQTSPSARIDGDLKLQRTTNRCRGVAHPPFVKMIVSNSSVTDTLGDGSHRLGA